VRGQKVLGKRKNDYLGGDEEDDGRGKKMRISKKSALSGF